MGRMIREKYDSPVSIGVSLSLYLKLFAPFTSQFIFVFTFYSHVNSDMEKMHLQIL